MADRVRVRGRQVLGVPERSPSPKIILVDLIDAESTEGGGIPELIPTTTRIWVDLQDAETLPRGVIPEMDPNPSFILINLQDIEEEDAPSLEIQVPHQAVSGDAQNVDQSEISAPLQEASPGLTLYEIDGSMVSGTPAPPTVAVPAVSNEDHIRFIQTHIDVVAANKTTLEELYLVRLTLTRESARALADLLPTLGALKHLNMANFPKVRTGSAADREGMLGIICNALTSRNNPFSLTFSSMSIDPSIIPFIQSNNCLESLALHTVDMTGATFPRLCLGLIEWSGRFIAEKKDPPLRSLSFTRCKLGANYWRQLGGIFSVNLQLQKIDLSANALGEDAIAILLGEMAPCTQLVELNLSGNARSQGRTASMAQYNALTILGQTLPSWPLLRTLRLTDLSLSNNRGDGLFDGFQNLGAPLLEVLDVSGVDSQAAGRLKVVVRHHLLHLIDLGLRPSPQLPKEDVQELENILKSRNLDATLSV